MRRGFNFPPGDLLQLTWARVPFQADGHPSRVAVSESSGANRGDQSLRSRRARVPARRAAAMAGVREQKAGLRPQQVRQPFQNFQIDRRDAGVKHLQLHYLHANGNSNH